MFFITAISCHRVIARYSTLVGGDEEGGKEAGVRLANVLTTNTTITRLNLRRTNLIGSDNVAQWGDALMRNKTLNNLSLRGVGADIRDELKAKTKDRTPDLKIH